MKRSRHPSSSDDSDNGSNSTCWSQHSSQPRRGTGQKPSEVFRTDLITAMKVPDSYQLNPEDYYVLNDAWRQEWEKGVQVPVSPQSIPQPVTRVLVEKGKEVTFVRPKKLIRTSGTEALGYVDIKTLAEGTCRYDLNEEDVAWLQVINREFTEMALPPLDEVTMELVMEELERRCHENMTHAMETEEGLGIEYDEDVVCDVCQSPDGEDNNEMVFCDKCNICVHQACYGIQKVPTGSWLCRICALGILPKCQLCPKKGGAMKPTRSGTKWVHVSCALWIPEVSIGNPEKMEPITNVSQIPSNRWALICCMCKEKTGACIQCSAKNCRTAFHVTCGLHAGLEMNTILTEDDEVKFKSYCPKHSGLEGAESRDSAPEEEEKEKEKEGVRDKKGKRRGRVRGGGGGGGGGGDDSGPAASSSFSSSAPLRAEELSSRQQEKRVNQRKLKLEAMEEDFHQFVQAEEVAAQLKLPVETVDFVFQFWKLKRKANFNQPLVTPKKDEEESLARREQEVLLRRLQLFTHLRQDLERVRNLTYMVTRREKMKRSLWRVQEQIFQHQVRLMDQELLSGDPSAKDLEKFFSLGWISSSSSSPSSSSSSSSSSRSSWGLKAKRASSKQDKRRSTDRRNLPDSSSSSSSHSQSRREDPGRPTEQKETRGPRLQEEEVKPEPTPPPPPTPTPPPPPAPPQVEIKKAPRREETEEERRRKRRSEEVKEVRRSLERTVSVRLVDIRSSDHDDFFCQEGVARRTQVHLRGWGKFRIPKRSERAPPPAPVAVETPLLRPLSNNTAPSYPRTRQRAGAEGDGFAPKASGGGGAGRGGAGGGGAGGDSAEAEPQCIKRCHSHKLRGDATLARRYGSDIIRRGVLAS